MSDMHVLPVIIVGGGPTGLATALELTRQGVRVRIFDQSPHANTESRGTGLQARTLELLDLYDASEEILARSNRAKAFITFRHGEEIGRIDFTLAAPRFGGSPVLPQAITEDILRNRLAAAGVAVEFGIQVGAIDRAAEQCTVHATDAAGRPIAAAARWVVGADGARSVVRTLLDLPFDGVSYPEGWGLMDATLDWPLAADAVRVFRGDGPQQFVVVPLGGDQYRLQLDHRADAVQAAAPDVAEMQAAYDRYVPHPGSISAPAWRSSFRVHRRQVVAYRDGRVLLAGDAAHIHTPAGAQGLNTGIQDGINLGWKLALVASGKADAALLESYQDERKPIAAGVLQLAEVLARNPEAMLGDGSVPPEILSARVGQLFVSYRDGPLAQAPTDRTGPVAGDRLPDVEIGGAWLYSRLRPGGIVVAVFGGGTDIASLAVAWGGAIRIWHVDADDPEGVLATALGLSAGAAVIRPDGYLGAIVAGGAPSGAIGTWLAETLHLYPTVEAVVA
ncbi:MAG TPA: FAD-dependent oxidoreductase [Sphingomonas sp.]|jgi:2-polyprenyl-6-methoxyphenol hydroxylase-like FAD-dependent oxidoreductase|uniref:FAD-dependent oxidoreductase n=1 Tax=Sphingomonas sp. TaxID=28214 RepID=UPI002EDA1B10